VCKGIGIFCRLAPSPKVPSSKAGVFRGLHLTGVKLFHLEGVFSPLLIKLRSILAAILLIQSIL